MHPTHRRLLLALGAVAAAVALTGCVNLKTFTWSQPTPVGGVLITSEICRSGSTGCADGGGNSTLTPAANSNVDSQVLLGYRVTTGSTPPASLRFFGDGGTGPEFTPSASYTSELQRLAPAPAGQQWFGYISTRFTSTPAVTSAAISAPFGLPVSPNGSPFSSTYTYLVVVGAREADAQNDPNRPVSCGTSLFAINDGGICIDSPIPNDVTSFKTIPALRDFGIAGGTGAVEAGGTATVPFGLRSNAVPAGTSVTLATSTAAPSGAATVSPGSVTLVPNGTVSVGVRVKVDPGTPPGDYTVRLTAVNGSDLHAGQGLVRVVRPGAGGGGGGGGGGAAGLPRIGATVAPKSIQRTRRAAPAVVTANLSDPGTVRMVVSRAAVGRRKPNGACVAPTGALIRNGARRCTRFVPVATITKANLGAGRRTIPFSGRGRAAGTYRLTLTLRAGGQVSLPAVVTVTVKP